MNTVFQYSRHIYDVATSRLGDKLTRARAVDSPCRHNNGTGEDSRDQIEIVFFFLVNNHLLYFSVLQVLPLINKIIVSSFSIELNIHYVCLTNGAIIPSLLNRCLYASCCLYYKRQ